MRRCKRHPLLWDQVEQEASGNEGSSPGHQGLQQISEHLHSASIGQDAKVLFPEKVAQRPSVPELKKHRSVGNPDQRRHGMKVILLPRRQATGHARNAVPIREPSALVVLHFCWYQREQLLALSLLLHHSGKSHSDHGQRGRGQQVHEGPRAPPREEPTE